MNYFTRPVEMKDADFLLRLKNDATSRKYAIASKAKIKKKNHLKWLAGTLQNPNVIYFLILVSETAKPCGTVRFDLVDGKAEIAIHITKQYRGRGIATQIIKTLGGMIARHHNRNLTAKIVDGNMRSMMVFLKNGFNLKEHSAGVSYLEKSFDA